MRIWAKIFKNNRMLRDTVIENTNINMTRTQKVFDAIDQICYSFDLSKPIWLDANIEEFKRINKTRFREDNFIDTISFDFLELYVIEEDDDIKTTISS